MAASSKHSNPAVLRWVLLAACLVLSLVLMVVYTHEGSGGPLHVVQAHVSAISSPFRLAGTAGRAGVEALGDGVENVTASEETLTELKETNRELREQLAQLEEYQTQVEELQALLKLKDSYGAEGVGARVIGWSTNAWDQTITIDKGSSDGIEAGLSVMGNTGLIGQVVSVTEHTATVRLLTDPQSGAAAKVQNRSAQGVVRGSLEGMLYLEDVDEDADIEVGDNVVTSGMGGSYVSGLLIGIVTKVDTTRGDASRLIVVLPGDTASSLETVLVVFSTSSSYSSLSGISVADSLASDEQTGQEAEQEQATEEAAGEGA